MFGTELQLITFLYLVIEFVILSIQVAVCLSRPKDTRRFRFLILTLLFILFNLSNGLFPNSNYSLTSLEQIILSYSSGIALATYYFYYLVNELKIQSDRFFNTKFLLSSLLLSFIVGFVTTYLVTGDIALSQEVFIVPPIFLSLYFSIRTMIFIFKSQKRTSSHFKLVTISGYIGIVFMASMPIAVFFGDHQSVKVGLINISFLLSAFALYKNQLYQSRMEYNALHRIGYFSQKEIEIQIEISSETLLDFELTPKEVAVSHLILCDLTYCEIGEELFIAERTASKHASNIFKKTECTCKKDFISRFSQK